jgi:hypothetical protein
MFVKKVQKSGLRRQLEGLKASPYLKYPDFIFDNEHFMEVTCFGKIYLFI